MIWLVSGRSPKAPAAFRSSICVLETFGQAAENSSMEMKSLPLRCSTTCNKLSKTHIEQLKALGAFAGMADTSQVALF